MQRSYEVHSSTTKRSPRYHGPPGYKCLAVCRMLFSLLSFCCRS